MKKNEVHPAAIRSKYLLTNSLLDLMKTTSYESISVKEIADHATLTRRTFYAHFKSKDDILSYKLSSLNDELINRIRELELDNIRQLSLTYFDFWISHGDFMKLMYKNKLLPFLFSSHEKGIKELRILVGCDIDNMNKEYYNYSSSFYVGVLSSILTRWIEGDSKENAEQLVDILWDVSNRLVNALNQDQ